ncbi:MAG: RNA polymerase factor sigma-32, partial [Gammaproteobacteria bacterium]|nr:RNA polymerase factor sigma-32 [Gammaproteobacteria bacterium]
LSDDKLTLKALAKKYNISLERVRQIEENAIIKLRESFTQT